MFESKPVEFELPTLTDLPIDDLYDQMEILGFPLVHPFGMIDEDHKQYLSI